MNHSTRIAFCYAALLGLMLGFSSVFAQEDPRLWDTDGVAVRQGTHLEWQRQTAIHDNGSICVVWSDTQFGQRAVYFQIISSDGTLLLEDQGRLAVQSEFHCVDPVVCTVSDGWIIGWLSHTSWAGEGSYLAQSIGAQKINLNGALQWSDEGVEVYYDPEKYLGEASLRIVQDANSGAMLAWEEGRYNYDVSAAHITAAGILDWADILHVTDIAGDQRGIQAATDGQGNMIVAWNDSRITNNTDIYAAKIMADGSLPWGEGVNGIPVCTSAYRQTNVKLCSDVSTGGVYCAWEDRTVPGDENLYIQRISGDGTMLWQENGIQLCVAPDKQLRPYIASSFNNDLQDGAVAVWQDIRVNGYVNEVYAQKVSPDGTMLWAEDGVLVCGNAGPQTSGETRDGARVISDRAGGAYISWDDTRDSQGNMLEYDLYAARLDANGNNLWSECGELVQDGPSAQHAAAMTFHSQQSLLEVVYIDESQGSQIIEHQRLAASDGSPLLETENTVFVSMDGDATQPHAVQLSENRVGIVWEDDRGGNLGKMVYYQIVDNSGGFVCPPYGVPVAPDNTGYQCYQQEDPALASDGNGGFFVAFADNRTGRNKIRLSKINSQGEVVSDPAGVLVHDYLFDQQVPFVCPDGNGGCYVAWQANDISFTLDVYVHHFDENCEALWAEPVRLTADGVVDDMIKALIPSDGCCIPVWITADWDPSQVKAVRICSDGEIDWTTTIGNLESYFSNLTATEDGLGGVIVAWEDERSEITGWDIYAQYLNINGEPLWQENGIPVVTEADIQNLPTALYSPAHGLYVVWEDFRSGVHLDLFAQRIDLSGNLLWESSGLLLCGEESDQWSATVSLNDQGGILVVWSDHRGDYTDIYGTNLLPNGQTTDEWWVEDSGGIICDAPYNQTSPVVAPMSETQTLIACTDWRSTTASPLQNIYMQAVNVGTISGRDDSPEITPVSFALHQNYPNPFNPTTTISFSIPTAGQTSLVIYDLLGRSVETLVNKQLTAGSYHVSWNAGALPSGVYFYRLTAGEFSDVKKTILLK